MQLLKLVILITVTFCFSLISQAQTGEVSGLVTANDKALEFITVQISGTSLGEITNSTGSFLIKDIPYGNYKLTASAMGYESITKPFVLDAQNLKSIINFDLKESQIMLDKFVVTGTKTFKRQTESAVIANIIDSKTLENVQACNLSEGLKFQPGLRVETDCQTCNYTQLRMNGLAGGYSQILINGRPILVR